VAIPGGNGVEELGGGTGGMESINSLSGVVVLARGGMRHRSEDRVPIAGGVSELSVNLEDFPAPPVFLDGIKRLSTSLTADIEVSLNMSLESALRACRVERPLQGAVVQCGALVMANRHAQDQRMLEDVRKRLQCRDDRQREVKSEVVDICIL